LAAQTLPPPAAVHLTQVSPQWFGSFLRTHALELQQLPGAQFVIVPDVQLPAHPLPTQAKLPPHATGSSVHAESPAIAPLPAARQTCTCWCVGSATSHDVPPQFSAQQILPPPSLVTQNRPVTHSPALAHVWPAVLLQVPFSQVPVGATHTLPAPAEASSPEATGLHVPIVPPRLQAWHLPLHALLQHTPSTHGLPALHGSGSADGHIWPFSLKQMPAMHTFAPAAPHSRSVPASTGEQVPLVHV